MNSSIKIFHDDHYGPMINKQYFCLQNVTIIREIIVGKQDVNILKGVTCSWM